MKRTPEEVQAARAKLAEEQMQADWKHVMATEAGRRFVWRIIDELSGATNGSFVAGVPDLTSYNEGRRHVGLQLITEAQRITEKEYVHMVCEQLASQRAEESARKATEDAHE
jgi:hypothetical protein